MSKNTPTPEGIGPSVAPYSPVVVSGDLVFLAGQIPYDENSQLVEGDIEVQTRQVLNNMGRCLRAAGCGFEDVLKVFAVVADFSDFAGFNAVYQEFFKPPFPARMTIQAGLYGFRVELEAIARRPDSGSATAGGGS
jgi:2-iminobutanoate/2-iminopropanoate deaminase